MTRRPITLEALLDTLVLASHDREMVGWVVVFCDERVDHRETVGPFPDPREANAFRDRLRSEVGEGPSVEVFPLYPPDSSSKVT